MAPTSAPRRCRPAKAAPKCTSSPTSTGRRRIFCATCKGKAWHFSILRPVLIVGLAMGGAMDLIPPLGVYAAMLREQGRPLDYPGGAARVSQAVDVDLLARAIAWSGEAEAARNEAFNVTNGDVFTWENIWPAVADALGMKPGKPVPLSLRRNLAEMGRALGCAAAQARPGRARP